MTIEYTIAIPQSSADEGFRGGASPKPVPPARIARLLALAHRFDGLVRARAEISEQNSPRRPRGLAPRTSRSIRSFSLSRGPTGRA